MIRELAYRQGAPIGDAEIRMLAEDPRRRGCGSCFLGLVITGVLKLTLRLVTKIFRRITVVLVLKESVDTASHTFLQGYLLGLALAGPTDRLPEVPQLPWDREETWKVTWALSAASRDIDTKPLDRAIKKAFWGSWVALGKAARKLASWVRRHPDEEVPTSVPSSTASSQSEETVDDVTDRMADRLIRERGTLDRLEASFRAHLSAPTEADEVSGQIAEPSVSTATRDSDSNS